jgi:hypothetical protein
VIWPPERNGGPRSGKSGFQLRSIFLHEVEGREKGWRFGSIKRFLPAVLRSTPMPNRKNIIQLIILIAVAALVLGARFSFVSPPTASRLITKWGYWAVALTFAGFVMLLIKSLPAIDGLWKQRKVHLAGLLCIFLAGIYFQAHEPREFKVLFDEFVVSGVARNMHFDRQPTYPGRAHYFTGRLVIMESGVDKRPLFFPLIISLVHDLTGYRPENVFYVNAGLAVVLLMLVYAYGFKMGGARLGCLGVLILAGLPLIAQNATGGGFELMNVVMIMALYFAGCHYYRSPGTQGLNLFILTAVLLAQARYESLLYVLIVPAVAICKWRHERRITLTWMSAIAPVMLLTPLLENKVFISNTGFFQTGPGQAFLSVHYLLDNAEVAMFYLFYPSFDSTNSLLLSVLGLFGVAFFVFLAVTKIKQWFLQRNDDIVLLFIFGVTCVATAVALCDFWGHWDDPMVARFSLPPQLLMVILTLRITVEFLQSRPLPKWTMALAGMWIVLFAAPSSTRHFQTNNIITASEYRWLFQYLAPKDPTSTLTIAGSCVGPILHNMPAISIASAKQSRWQIKTCLDEGIYREIIVIQRFIMDYKLGKYVESGPEPLGPGFKLETIAEQRFRPDMISRISRVVDVDMTKVHPPDGLEKPPFKNQDAFVNDLIRKLP